MRRMILTVLVLGMSIIGASVSDAKPLKEKVETESLKGRLGIGVGYPVISLRYGITNSFLIEGRGAFGSGILALGPRVYYYPPIKEKDKLFFYMGIEGNLVKFDDVKVEKIGELSGNGHTVGGFIGVEFFPKEHIGLSVDIGPTHIGVTDKETDVTAGRVLWITNIGVTLYF